MWISIHAQSMDESINYMVDEEKTVVINLARLRSLERLWHVCTSSVVAVNLYYRSKKAFRILRAATVAGAHIIQRIDEVPPFSRYGYIVALRTPPSRAYVYLHTKQFSLSGLARLQWEYINFSGIYRCSGTCKAFWTIQVHLLCTSIVLCLCPHIIIMLVYYSVRIYK